MILPTTQEWVDLFIANLEARLNQTTPAADRAYNAVLAAVLGMGATALGKYAADRHLASFVMDARGADLDRRGNEYGVVRKTATSALLTLTLTGTDATVIPAGTVFVADANQGQYVSQAEVTIVGGTCAPVVSALAPGTSGNLTVGDTLVMQVQIVGATGIPVVASVTTVGTDAELDEPYRVRVLDVQRAPGGGGNSADYRNWAQGVDGVVRCYPYAGPPAGEAAPGMRTLYIECDPSIQADGISPQALLDAVRAAVTADPVTGRTRQPLGMTDGTLYVEPIIRTALYVQIVGLSVPSLQAAACAAAIDAAVSAHLQTIEPFVAGVDPVFARNDTVTNLSLGRVVQAVLAAFGASASNIAFGTYVGEYRSSYTMQQGERVKLGAVAYV